MSRPGNIFSMCVRKVESMAIISSKWPWTGQSLIIQICPSRSMIVALISPTFSSIRTLTSFLPLMISSRASITQFGQSESVVRGQPKVGLLFCHDFSRGLSDHFGVKEGLGLYLLTDWIALKIPPAISVNPLSACFTGRISLLFPSSSIVNYGSFGRLKPYQVEQTRAMTVPPCDFELSLIIFQFSFWKAKAGSYP